MKNKLDNKKNSFITYHLHLAITSSRQNNKARLQKLRKATYQNLQ